MNDSSTDKITLYTSKWCSHSRSVQSFLERNEVAVNEINIDGNEEARSRLIELNNGYASVPTLIFPDGAKLTEPTLYQVREKLGMEQPPGLANRIRNLLSGDKNN
ncbi:MAG TPA: glutaredoxin family protein [candidate division Zixibacteria bacterium]|nr:glutaredoxin family protein [candidate division Zixibacteria bacterium]